MNKKHDLNDNLKILRKLIFLEAKKLIREASESELHGPPDVSKPIITGELAKRVMLKGVNLREIPKEKIYKLFDELCETIHYLEQKIVYGNESAVAPEKILPIEYLRGPKGPDAIIEDAIYRAMILYTTANVDTVKNPKLYDADYSATWHETTEGTWYESSDAKIQAGFDSIAAYGALPSNKEIQDGSVVMHDEGPYSDVSGAAPYLHHPDHHPVKGKKHSIRPRVLPIDYVVANYICTLLAQREHTASSRKSVTHPLTFGNSHLNGGSPDKKGYAKLHRRDGGIFRGMSLPTPVVNRMIASPEGPYPMGDIASFSTDTDTPVGFMNNGYSQKVNKALRAASAGDQKENYSEFYDIVTTKGKSIFSSKKATDWMKFSLSVIHGNERIMFHCPRPTRGTDIRALSGYRDEAEVLSGGSFKIIHHEVISEPIGASPLVSFGAFKTSAGKINKDNYHLFTIELI